MECIKMVSLYEFFEKKIFLICLLTITCYSSYGRTEDQNWIDPHEMSINNVNIMKSDRRQIVEESKCIRDVSDISLVLEHYKRLINFILNNANYDDKSSSFKGYLNLNIPLADHKFLLYFIRENLEENSAQFRKIDQILNRILTKTKMEDFTDFLVSWTDYVYFTLYNRTMGIILLCTFLIVVSYKLWKSNITLNYTIIMWSVVKYVIFMLWILDFAFTWIKLLEEAEINQLADGSRYKVVPINCDPEQMYIWQYMWYSISTDTECRQYYQTKYADIFWTVTPLQVISHQLGIVIYTPAMHIGKAIGSFSSGILSTLPWGVNVVLLPGLLLFTLLTFGILLSFATETSFHLNFLRIINVNFGNPQRSEIGDILTGRNLTTMLDAVHRNMIEEVRPNTSPNSNIESCICSGSMMEMDATKSVQSNIPESVNDNKKTDDGSGDK